MVEPQLCHINAPWEAACVEVSLVDRGEFTYRLLLGRTALESFALIDPGNTFLSRPQCRIAEKADETGILSVEKYLLTFDIEKHKEVLAYPAPVKEGYIGRVFDELYYGPDLIKRQNGLVPKY